MWVVLLCFSLCLLHCTVENSQSLCLLFVFGRTSECSSVLFPEKLFSFLSFGARNLAIWQPNAKIFIANFFKLNSKDSESVTISTL